MLTHIIESKLEKDKVKPELHYVPWDILPIQHRQKKAKNQVQIGIPDL